MVLYLSCYLTITVRSKEMVVYGSFNYHSLHGYIGLGEQSKGLQLPWLPHLALP